MAPVCSHSCRKHEEDLIIRYDGVSALSLDVSRATNSATTMLGEIMPHPGGCSHEIALQSGTMKVTCRDVTAVWTKARRPDEG
ncbi:hypothetical protein GCM10010116_58220 [Microbispora rosea subsp. aerata]|nr:hypothetical protein GCM10010116_58220 [Microbispora rosea subsp. aerata]GIH58809.1 hypothetical protein Mro02_57230 [Microbispora rosea subsp. aerata]GLJ86715.1 hypothetical protein GCM10017588_54540 [Microbispora rosea subsp. aerata]